MCVCTVYVLSEKMYLFILPKHDLVLHYYFQPTLPFSPISLFVLIFLRFKDHPTLNERYLLLHLLGRGGFSEVYKVSLPLIYNRA